MAAKGIVTANGQVTSDADLDSALSMLPILRDQVNPYGGIKYDLEWVLTWWEGTGEEYFSTQGGRKPL